VSRLLERLRRAVRGEAPRPLGFGRPPADSGRVSPLVLVARLADWDLDLVAGLRSAGFDLLVLPGRPEPPAPAELESLAGVTWGIDLTGPAPAGPAQAHFQAGADFIVIDPGAPAEILGREGSTYLALTPDFPDTLLRSLDLLPVEGFWLRTGTARGLTVSELLAFLKFAAVTRKPVVYEPGEPPAPGELPALRDAGVVALAVPAAPAGLEELRRLSEAVAELPRRRVPAGERPAVTVPPTAAAAAPQVPAPEPDEDEEE